MRPRTCEESAVIVGSGPNGLAAAIEVARAGVEATVLEQGGTPGGGVRSAELTLPGFTHDICSAVHPLAVASPFFRGLDLERFGLAWVHPQLPLAHPLDDGSAVVLERSLSATARGLGEDGPAYERLMDPLLQRWDGLVADVLGAARLPRHPLTMVAFAVRAAPSAGGLAARRFRGPRARALLAGLAAHSGLALQEPFSASFGVLLGAAAHAVGWPLPAGGAQRLTEALVACLASLGGRVVTGHRVASLDDVAAHDMILLDVTPRQLLALARGRLRSAAASRLGRYRYGPGVFKVDWALGAPIPWRAAPCRRAGTVHLGGSLEEIAGAEAEVCRGGHPERPFVVLVQPTLFDPSRAPSGKHIAWAYCHVPNGSTRDMREAVEDQVERFAPGFRNRVLARHTLDSDGLEAHNPNLVGGDISGGLLEWRQLLFRPTPRLTPHATPIPGTYLCSASTPPGPGVHGMCGHLAARAALRGRG
jgi:phytoene dehydrogenase-like protein